MWQGVNEKELNEPLLDEGEAGSRPSADEPRKDAGWISKVIPGYSAPPTTATTPSTYSPRTNGGAAGGGGLAGDAFWAKNTGPSTSPQKGAGGSGGILSKVLDVVVGPDIEPYGFILGSLEEGDERHLKQLNTTLPNDKTIPGTSNTRKVLFKKLESTGYERSIVPFASDANPLGDVGALGVGLVVRDGMWGPDLLEQSTDDQNYWQIIGAAQELAINVVFIFIRHRDSMHLEPGEVCHQKFKRLAKGPWPQKQPYVFLMSYWGHLNDKQIEVIKTCLAIKDPLEVKLAINKLVVKTAPKDDTNGAAVAMTQSAPDLALPSKEKGKKGWLFSSTGGLRNSSKGKEKEGGATARGGGGNSQEEWRQFKKKLLKKNRKQMTMLMAAELHEMRERDRHVLKLENKVEELTKEVDRLKEELKLAQGV